ncbi:MAG: GNAT family N-acetyltransferase [Bacteroidales bacterium]|nr:GNAT family N-acetyltransferase [Bacteroidales bacterium]
MIAIADYDFVNDDIQLPFYLGEKTIFSLKFTGYRCHTDIFENPEITVPSPPLEDFKDTGHCIAYTGSCPLTKKMPRLSFHQRHICYVIRQYRRFYISTDTGFDTNYNKYSPGTVLQYKTIETAFAHDQLKIYDFCTGEGKHKSVV